MLFKRKQQQVMIGAKLRGRGWPVVWLLLWEYEGGL